MMDWQAASLAVPSQQQLEQRVHREAQHVFERVFYPAITGLWLVGVLLAALVALVDPSKRITAFTWLAVNTGAVGATFSVWYRSQKQALTTVQKDIRYGVLTVPHGLLWVAAVVLFFDPQQPLITLFLVCMLAGTSAGAVTGMAALPHLFWLLMVPGFMAQSVTYAYAWGGHDAFHGLLALAMVLLLVANLIFVHAANRTVKQSIRLGFENTDLVELLRAQTAAALEANTAKTKFLAAASHDLRQPVHALMLFLEVLGNTQLDDHQRTLMGHLRAASQASSELLNTLLDFSRIEAGVMEPQPHATPLAPLLRELEDEFGPQADGKDLVYRTHDTEAVAYCDRALVALILRNFVSNAVRYTQRGGMLIGVRSQGGFLRVQVCDSGIGIAAAHHEAIFKDFHQLGNDERDRQKGLGLGLAIARGLALSMGVRITLSSREGRGSVFTLWLPKASPTLRPLTLGEQATKPPDVRIDLSQLEGLHVLVVDDEEAVRLSMLSLLQSWGCKVRAAEGPEDALRLAQQHLPQLLITDYRLRNRHTGGEVITALRELQGDDLPAIIVTGDTDPERLRETALYHATLLHKPVNPQALREAMAALIQPQGQA